MRAITALPIKSNKVPLLSWQNWHTKRNDAKSIKYLFNKYNKSLSICLWPPICYSEKLILMMWHHNVIQSVYPFKIKFILKLLYLIDFYTIKSNHFIKSNRIYLYFNIVFWIVVKLTLWKEHAVHFHSINLEILAKKNGHEYHHTNSHNSRRGKWNN